ncbi:hypothetical protein QBC33DRAFT_526087, partial [Phialemonium atrogriseum]
MRGPDHKRGRSSHENGSHWDGNLKQAFPPRPRGASEAWAVLKIVSTKPGPRSPKQGYETRPAETRPMRRSSLRVPGVSGISFSDTVSCRNPCRRSSIAPLKVNPQPTMRMVYYVNKHASRCLSRSKDPWMLHGPAHTTFIPMQGIQRCIPKSDHQELAKHKFWVHMGAGDGVTTACSADWPIWARSYEQVPDLVSWSDHHT